MLLLHLLGCFGLFFLGMRLLSEGVQRLSAERLRQRLDAIVGRRLAGLANGLWLTAAIQASSATVLLCVSLVHSGVITLGQAVPVVMGAAVGTTLKFWALAWVGYSLDWSVLALPVVGLGAALMISRRGRLRDWGQCLAGFGLFFLGIGLLRTAASQPENLEWLRGIVSQLPQSGWPSALAFCGAGVVLAFILQSSSLAGAVTMVLAGGGALSPEHMAALIIGENIGTTIVPLLLSLPYSVDARRTALAHLLLKLTGAVWALLLFTPFLSLVRSLLPDAQYLPEPASTLFALYHTLFNALTVAAWLPVAPLLAALATRLWPAAHGATGGPAVRRIRDPMTGTGELQAFEAAARVRQLATHACAMVARAEDWIRAPAGERTGITQSQRAAEEEADELSRQASEHLLDCASQETGEDTTRRLALWQRVCAEWEEIADSAHRLTKDGGLQPGDEEALDSRQLEGLSQLARETRRFVEFARDALPSRPGAAEWEHTRVQLANLRRHRRELRAESLRRLDRPGRARAETRYLRLLDDLKSIQRHAYNVVEMLHAAQTPEPEATASESD